MPRFRIIPRLEVKSENVVKGIRMEGLRVVGKPSDMSIEYYHEGADEILFIDTVASLYDRNQLHELVSDVSRHIHVPLSVGGGVRSIDDCRMLLRTGADKITINTQACSTPEIITEAAKRYGAQCVVVSIQAKRQENRFWEAYNQNGRERTRMEVTTWAKEVVNRGAGEILLTSIDQDGTRKGLDFELIETVLNSVNVPVIVGGGVGSIDDVIHAAHLGASGITIAHMFHFKSINLLDLKNKLLEKDVDVRISK